MVEATDHAEPRATVLVGDPGIPAMTRARYKVRPSALRLWEEFAEIPHLLTDVVDAIESLPVGQREVTRQMRPPGVIYEVSGVAFGRRFKVRGVQDVDGKWMEVWSVAPL